MALGTRQFQCVVGENLFYSSRRDVALGHRSLMNSPTHRDNIVASDYQTIGVGDHLPTGDAHVARVCTNRLTLAAGW